MRDLSEIKSILDTVTSALYAYKSAVSSNAGILSAKERLKNLLFTHCEFFTELATEHEKTLRECRDLEMRLQMTEEALAESDEENAELKRTLKEQEARAAALEQLKPKARKSNPNAK